MLKQGCEDEGPSMASPLAPPCLARAELVEAGLEEEAGARLSCSGQ